MPPLGTPIDEFPTLGVAIERIYPMFADYAAARRNTAGIVHKM